jgi:hypothetical protein
LLIDPQGRIDNAGKATISEAVSNGFVNGSNAGLFDNLTNQLDETIKIYPNPANAQTTISINLKDHSKLNINVLDASGKIMSSKYYGGLVGNWDINLDTTGFKAGIYFVEIECNDQKVTKRLVIE